MVRHNLSRPGSPEPEKVGKVKRLVERGWER
jgi:hypothetical protein